jgi:hypothetical protein
VQRVAAAIGEPRVVALELLDLLLLLGDHRLDQIADRHETHHAPAVDDRQVAHVAVGHELHALLHRGLEHDRDDRRAHDVAHRGVGRGAAAQDHFARVVALGHDALERRCAHDEQGADVVLGHEPDGIEDGRLRLHREDRPALAFEQRPYRGHAHPPA